MTDILAPQLPSRLDDILNRVEAGLGQDLVPVDIFNDPGVFAAEMERIFLRTWVYVAHETEIPNPGDFVQRRIGVDPVIVTRDGDGDIHVLSNYCRHRGTQVCQTDQGNSRFFKCPYHGWTYSNNGDLIGTPFMKRACRVRLDKSVGPLEGPTRRVPPWLDFRLPIARRGLARGLPRRCRLDARHTPHLAPRRSTRRRAARPLSRQADWKTAAENFCGDVYHVPTLHKSGPEIGLSGPIDFVCEAARPYEFENGHSFLGIA